MLSFSIMLSPSSLMKTGENDCTTSSTSGPSDYPTPRNVAQAFQSALGRASETLALFANLYSVEMINLVKEAAALWVVAAGTLPGAMLALILSFLRGYFLAFVAISANLGLRSIFRGISSVSKGSGERQSTWALSFPWWCSMGCSSRAIHSFSEMVVPWPFRDLLGLLFVFFFNQHLSRLVLEEVVSNPALCFIEGVSAFFYCYLF